MSSAKRAKLESHGAGKRASQRGRGAEEPTVVVDLGNGRSARLRTRGSENDVIQAGRWQQIRDELHGSDFRQRSHERLDESGPAQCAASSDEAVEREIQRAWDASGRTHEQQQLPHLVDGPDIPLEDRGSVVGLSELAQRKESKKEDNAEEEAEMRVDGGMQRYLVTLEYSGTRFLGWQKQTDRPDLRTVQGVLEAAFHKFVGKPVACGGSSRTDTGVHALANVCHVDVERVSKRKPGEVLPPHAPEIVKRAVNHFLQKDGGDMAVVNVRTVPADFHARFQATERTYHYRILSGGTHPSIFEKDRAWQVPETLNLPAMQEASQILIGNHDFSCFRASGCQAKSPVKTLDELHVCEVPPFHGFPTFSDRNRPQWSVLEPDTQPNWRCAPSLNHDTRSMPIKRMSNSSGGRLESDSAAWTPLAKTPRCFVITARAQSFLYHQVRLMVGTLKAVGCGLLDIDDVRKILESNSNNTTPPMAPACGLYLAQVQYNFNEIEGRDCASHENSDHK